MRPSLFLLALYVQVCVCIYGSVATVAYLYSVRVQSDFIIIIIFMQFVEFSLC